MKIIRQRTVKAFTLTEIILVMVLSTLLSVMVYRAMLIVSSLYTRFDNNQQKTQIVMQIISKMSKDIQVADRIKVDETTMRLFHDKDSSTFRSLADAVFHNDYNGNIDSCQGFRLSFVPWPANELPETISVTVSSGDDQVTWHFNKQYSSQQRIINWRTR